MVIQEALGWSGAIAKAMMPISMMEAAKTIKEKAFINMSDIRTR